MSAWRSQLVGVIEAIDEGLEAAGDFESKAIGPDQADRLSYPAVHIIPATVDYQDGNVYNHSIDVVHSYEFTHRYDYLELLDRVATLNDSALDAIEATDDLDAQGRVQTVEHFTRDTNDNLLVVIIVTFSVQTAVDLATYRD